MNSIFENNISALWGKCTAATLAAVGLKHAVISPGGRSGPLALGLALQKEICSLPILDERSAAFCALGIAKRTRWPVALLCTSGTALANYLPAVIEAAQSQTPLLVLSADCPAETHDCGTNQVIRQQGIFGSHLRFAHHFAEPHIERLAYLRQTLAYAFACSLGAKVGPVHLNFPIAEPNFMAKDNTRAKLKDFSSSEFVAHLRIPKTPRPHDPEALAQILRHKNGLIIAGETRNTAAEVELRALEALARHTGWPVLADVRSPAAHNKSRFAALIKNYGKFLNSEQPPKPDCIVQVGALPLSKALQSWLRNTAAPHLLIGSSTNEDLLHGKSRRLELDFASLTEELQALEPSIPPTPPTSSTPSPSPTSSTPPDSSEASNSPEPLAPLSETASQSISSEASTPPASLSETAPPSISSELLTPPNETAPQSTLPNSSTPPAPPTPSTAPLASSTAPPAPLAPSSSPEASAPPAPPTKADPAFVQAWLTLEQDAEQGIQSKLEAESGLFEGKLPWLLCKILPQSTPVFIGNSMPIRHSDRFWSPSDKNFDILSNCAVNGIDGLVSSAMGMAHAAEKPAVLLIGESSFLHDAGALINAAKIRGSLTIVLINNKGGRIFDKLAIATTGNPIFKEFFTCAHAVNFEQLAAAHAISYTKIANWQQLADALSTLPAQGLRILEVPSEPNEYCELEQMLSE